MQKNLKSLYIIIVGIILIVLVAMTLTQMGQPEQDRIISASFYPLAFLTQEIVGNMYTVHNITPNDIEPHNYEPTASTIAKLSRSKLFIHTGAHFESWGSRLAGLIKVEGGTSIAIVNPEAALRFGEGRDDELDPHTWISPKRSIEIVNTIMTALINIDPERAQTYAENGSRTIATLIDIDTNYNRVLSSCAKNELVTSHDAFRYLAKDYNLDVYTISGISPDSEPSPRDLVEITKLVNDRNITHIFMEELGTPKLVDTISRETGAQVLKLSPIESAVDGNSPFAQMNQNLENLKVALQCSN